jgi:hypothetical protein
MKMMTKKSFKINQIFVVERKIIAARDFVLLFIQALTHTDELLE